MNITSPNSATDDAWRARAMTAPTAPDRLAEIEGRMAAATPGPWEARPGLYAGKTVAGPREAGDLGGGLVTLMQPVFWTERSAHNADFIANAPADLAALVAVVKAVREDLREVIAEKPDYDRMQGYEIHQHDGRVEMAKGLLETIDETLEAM